MFIYEVMSRVAHMSKDLSLGNAQKCMQVNNFYALVRKVVAFNLFKLAVQLRHNHSFDTFSSTHHYT